MKDEPLKKCPKCNKTGVKRLVGIGAGLIFKGSGFYITDYKKSGGSSSSGGGDAKPAKSAESKSTGESGKAKSTGSKTP